MATPYTDGDWTVAKRNGPLIVSIDDNTRSYIYTHEMVQLAANWARLAINTVSPEGGSNLVHETEPQSIDGGCVSWSRVYADLPPSRDEYIPYVHNAQYIAVVEGDSQVLELPRATVARVRYDYFNTTTPASIEIYRAYKLITVGDFIINLWPPDPGYGVERIAEDSVIERWKWPGCSMWERRTIYVHQEPVHDYF